MHSIKNVEIRMASEVLITLDEIYFIINTQIYNFSSGPRITNFWQLWLRNEKKSSKCLF